MALLVEAVYDQLRTHLERHMGARGERGAFAGVVGSVDRPYAASLEPFRSFYNSLRFTGLLAPACFILPQRTDFDTGARSGELQNAMGATHEVLVIALVCSVNVRCKALAWVPSLALMVKSRAPSPIAAR